MTSKTGFFAALKIQTSDYHVYILASNYIRRYTEGASRTMKQFDDSNSLMVGFATNNGKDFLVIQSLTSTKTLFRCFTTIELN